MAEYVRQDHHLPHGSLEPHITNADKLRSMTDEELAEWMNDGWLDVAISKSMVSTEQWLAWLKRDAD